VNGDGDDGVVADDEEDDQWAMINSVVAVAVVVAAAVVGVALSVPGNDTSESVWFYLGYYSRGKIVNRTLSTSSQFSNSTPTSLT
jgi:hypothetical protein